MADGLVKQLQVKIVRTVLSYKKPDKILLYGSRATGHSNGKSDIDIAIFARGWDESDMNELRFRLDESLSVPLKIDIVEFYSLDNKRLKKNILAEGRVLYESRKTKRPA